MRKEMAKRKEEKMHPIFWKIVQGFNFVMALALISLYIKLGSTSSF